MKDKIKAIKLIYKVGTVAVDAIATAAAVGIIHHYKQMYRSRWAGYYLNDTISGWKAYLRG